MAEDHRTLWVGNLNENVTDDLLYELFLQTGPIEKLIFPKEGEKGQEKHKGHAYVVFKHEESVQYAAQVLEGSTLFSQSLSLKARSLPIQYKKAAPQPTSTSTPRGGRFDRYDNSSLRGGYNFNKSNTWHGQNDSFVPRGRGGYRDRGRGGYGGYNNSSSGYNNYQNQSNSNYSNSGPGQNQGMSSSSSYSASMDEKRQRLLQQQNLTLEAHRQIQQGVMDMANQMLMSQQQQQQQQQQQWSDTNNYASYNTSGGNWNNQGNMDQSNMYQSYTDQYGNWYQSQ
ncbi:RNA-binding protein 7-like [Plakobranchus ocellatus]|uniref:RNA-binding protein 7-like n=1 Tax=Plakobranchus ocellatus TaxID=259542 RepID=A0AAV4DF03_9GAST|nr:RNA-binding protein 7-like [Plakobranchus ocellatus]